MVSAVSDAAHQLFDPEAPPQSPSGEAPPEAERPGVLSIGDLYGEVEGALAAAFPRQRKLWVRGEIQTLSDQAGRSGHCYLDLVDPDERSRWQGRSVPTLKVKCWKDTWAPMKAALAKEGIVLVEGMVVVLRGTVNVYRPKGEIGFILSELDVTALLGGMAARRAALLKKLEAESLLRLNATVPVPDVAIRIGLVASPGSEGYRDFLGQLRGSGFGFDVRVVPVSVQGSAAPGAVATAIRALCRSDCDLIVLVRGGGSKADLVAFETEVVARTIANASKPIWTGIGHTGDESVADIVAARSFITPTECGHQLAVRLAAWWEEHVAQPSGALHRRVPALLAAAETRDAQARRRLTHAARSQLRVHRERVGRRGGAIGRLAPERLVARRDQARANATRLGPLSRGHLARESERVRSWQRLLTAYDVDRQLERGYSLTLDSEGQLVRSVEGLSAGDLLVTRLPDGSVRSRVGETERTDER
jgi:exodeoxyribonuclease VII large subunit